MKIVRFAKAKALCAVCATDRSSAVTASATTLRTDTRVLSFDPGAERCGWAVLDLTDAGLVYVASGIIKTPRLSEAFQDYRLRLIANIQLAVMRLVIIYDPDVCANETVPPVTTVTPKQAGGTFSSNGVQAQLAATAVTTLQAIAIGLEIPVVQISAITVKARVGGGKSASKVKVRNGVYDCFPEIKDEKWKDWVKVHDESDACAVGIVALSPGK